MTGSGWNVLEWTMQAMTARMPPHLASNCTTVNKICRRQRAVLPRASRKPSPLFLDRFLNITLHPHSWHRMASEKSAVSESAARRLCRCAFRPTFCANLVGLPAVYGMSRCQWASWILIHPIRPLTSARVGYRSSWSWSAMIQLILCHLRLAVSCRAYPEARPLLVYDSEQSQAFWTRTKLESF